MSQPDPLTDSFATLNGKHRGETVFIVGAGPQLARIPDAELQALGTRVTIGVNLTFYLLPPLYFLSAYIGQAMLARHRVPETRVLHMRPVYESPLCAGVMPLKRQLFDPANGLTDRFRAPEPILFTKRNVALGATHLAHILGARRIAYLGVEQRNQLHFWHLRPEIIPVMREDLEILRDVPFLTIDHPYATYEGAVAKIARTACECMKPFHGESHEETFREYFEILRAKGVEIVSTVADSVVCDAGAEFIPLSELLADGP